jgi:hypothetical protein
MEEMALRIDPAGAWEEEAGVCMLAILFGQAGFDKPRGRLAAITYRHN